MEPTLFWLENPEIFEVNRIPAHSDHKFYNEKGLLRQSLNGTWKFSYAQNPEQREKEFYRPEFSEDEFDEIQEEFYNTISSLYGKEFLEKFFEICNSSEYLDNL